MTQAAMFGYEPKPLKPVRTPAGGLGRPAYARYKVKKQVTCDACNLRALESLRAGEPLEPVRYAHWKRTQRGAETLLLCYEDAAVTRERDAELYGDLPAEPTKKKDRVAA